MRDLTTNHTFRVVVWELDPDPEFSECRSILDIREIDVPDKGFKKDGSLNAYGNRVIRNWTDMDYYMREDVCMVLERGPFGL